MAREERITYVCVCVRCNACTTRGVFVYTANIRTSACDFGPRNGRRNCAWITPTERFAPGVSPIFVVRSQKKKRKKRKNAGRPARQRNRLRCFSFVLTLRRGLHQFACNRREDICETSYALLFATQNLSSEREKAERERKNSSYTQYYNDMYFLFLNTHFPRYKIRESPIFS